MACGKRGDPLAPIVHVPAKTEELRIKERGGFIHLDWKAPDRTAQGSPKVDLKEAEIYRRVLDVAPVPAHEAPEAPPPPPAGVAATPQPIRGFADEAQVIATLEIPATAGPLSFRDPWNPSWQGKKLEYAVRHRNKKKRLSDFSPTAALEPRPPLDAPTGVTAASADGHVELCWDEEERGAWAYDVFRRPDPGVFENAPLNREPLPAPHFDDEGGIVGSKWCYQVRKVAVALSPETGEGEWRRLTPTQESRDSAETCITPIDTFPPSAPTDLVVASAAEGILLSWREVAAADRGGYLVYRAAAPEGPFELLTASAVESPSFTDASAASGQLYYYAVSALDKVTPPNESSKSRVVAPRAPRP